MALRSVRSSEASVSPVVSLDFQPRVRVGAPRLRKPGKYRHPLPARATNALGLNHSARFSRAARPQTHTSEMAQLT